MFLIDLFLNLDENFNTEDDDLIMLLKTTVIKLNTEKSFPKIINKFDEFDLNYVSSVISKYNI